MIRTVEERLFMSEKKRARNVEKPNYMPDGARPFKQDISV